MAMIKILIRPGVVLRFKEKDAKRLGLIAVEPEANKKLEPTAAKKPAKKKQNTEVTDVVRDDN